MDKPTLTQLITLATLLSLCPEAVRAGEELMALAPDAAYYAAAESSATERRVNAASPLDERPRPQLQRNTIKLAIPPPPSESAQRLKVVEVDPGATPNGVIDFSHADTANSFIPPPPGNPSLPRGKAKDGAAKDNESELLERLMASIAPTARPTALEPVASGSLRSPVNLPAIGDSGLPATKAQRLGTASVPGADHDFIPGLITPEHLVTHLESTAPGNNFAMIPLTGGADDLSDLVSLSSPVASVQSTQPTLIENIMANDIMTMAASPMASISERNDPYISTLEPFSIPSVSSMPAAPQPGSLVLPEPDVQSAVSFHSQPPRPVARELQPFSSAGAASLLSGSSAGSMNQTYSLQTEPMQSYMPVPGSVPVQDSLSGGQSALSGFGGASASSQTASASLPPSAAPGRVVPLKEPVQTSGSESGSSSSSGPLLLRIPSAASDATLGAPMLGSIAATSGPSPVAPVPPLTPMQPIGGTSGMQPSSVYWPESSGTSKSAREMDASASAPSSLSPGEFSGAGGGRGQTPVSARQSGRREREGASGRNGESLDGRRSSQPSGRVARQRQQPSREAHRDARRPATDGMTNMRGKNVIGPPDPKMFR